MLAAISVAKVVTAGIVKVVTVDYFVYAGIEVFTVENIGVNMGLELYSEEDWWRSFIGSRQYKITEIGNAKRLQTDLGGEAYKNRVTASELGCNTYGKWLRQSLSCATPLVFF